jgi:hypothetical protein
MYRALFSVVALLFFSQSSAAACKTPFNNAFYLPEECLEAVGADAGVEPDVEPADLPASLDSPGVQWTATLRQSALFLGVQQGYILATGRWARHNVVHGPFFRDWLSAVKGLRGWDDGDRFLDNYIGHPLQGAVSAYIFVQNDPKGRKQVFGTKGAYWKSRVRALGWAAVTSTQFEIGPLSEASIQNLGSYEYQNCATCPITRGMGYVDLVMTPAGGFGWMVMEDALDRFVVMPIERRKGLNHVVRVLRGVLNPARSFANAMRGKVPWYRDSRDPDGKRPHPVLMGDLRATASR